jgi:hypothetical protein
VIKKSWNPVSLVIKLRAQFAAFLPTFFAVAKSRSLSGDSRQSFDPKQQLKIDW